MTIREKLEEDIIQAMRDRDKVRLEALRFLKAKVQDVEKPLGKTLDDQGMLDAIARRVPVDRPHRLPPQRCHRDETDRT